jgi:RHS repeat-associated protein
VGEVDPSGNLDSSAEYDVYGTKRATTGTATSRQNFVGSLGHITDTETGLVYMQARYYDSNIGRFISEDPSENGYDWFNYGDSNPACNVDPSGKDSLSLLSLGWKLILAGVRDLTLSGTYFSQVATSSFESMFCDDSTPAGLAEKQQLSATAGMFADLGFMALTRGLDEIIMGTMLIAMSILDDDD